MVNPVKYHLDTQGDERLINIEPIYEEIGGGDLFPTGRYILYEAGEGVGEIRFDGELFEWDWNGSKNLDHETIFKIVQFIREYNEPELADYLD
ncbi:hypothetical protein [Mucilaginibacter ginsenosidivorans]|uniref:Uncharacterized protein n=1 Tax=Mucilaginibacter ginsenosidivorans TaxID=398053 RepID=A0A5B8UZV3_9SPHI|nr:hypothetical protein [Mucilaginibacter ginsenosidivorans]QEC63891.1 hypothetical protein FRZ54_15345 [Mucilaginibacter ginsenosidivorans]